MKKQFWDPRKKKMSRTKSICELGPTYGFLTLRPPKKISPVQAGSSLSFPPEVSADPPR